MTRKLMTTTVALVALVLGQQAVSGKVAFINLSLTQKTVQADAVVVGKVTEIEKEEVEVLPYQGATDKVKMRVGVIKVETGLIGAKNVTHVKVLLPGAAAEQPIGRPGRGGAAPITLKEGEEGLFFLAKHPTAANYYAINMGNTPVLNKAETYKDDVAKVKAIVATFADPMKALKAEKADERLLAVSALIQKYRRGLNVEAKEVAIPAEETKAILKVLAEADWTAAEKPQPGVAVDYQAQPMSLANQLGLFPGSPSGIPQILTKPGESYAAKFQDAFKAWVAKSGDKFEIKKFVPKD